MDRQTVYPGQILPETTLLQIAKDSMIGLAKLSASMLGTSTIANGFAVTPTGPASLQVVVAPGEIYASANIDSTAYSSLAADTTHSIVKQGVLLDSVTLTCAAPGTSGKSINYLIEAAYQDVDAIPVLLPYYNSANPSAPFSGLGNNGLTQNTSRQGAVVVQAKAGVMATTGSQVTPAPDSGYVGLYVVTVAYGQTTITSASIAQYASAPLLPAGLVPAIQANNMGYAKDFGTAGVYKCSYFPAITTLTDGMVLEFEVKTANPTTATFSPNGIGPNAIIGGSHSPLQGGEFVAGGKAEVMWHSTLNSWVLLGCTGGAQQVGPATQSQHAVQLQQMAAVVGGIRNGKMSIAAASATATFTADEVAVKSALGGAPWLLSNFSKTINLAGSGVGGMDTGVVPATGYIAVYAIYNPTTGVSALLSVNATSTAAPEVYGGANMPAGYTASALVSVQRIASSLFTIGYQTDRTVFTVLTTVLSTATQQGTATALNISTYAPLNAKSCHGTLTITSNASGSNLAASIGGSGASIGTLTLAISNTGVGGGIVAPFHEIPITTPQTIYYVDSASTGTINFAVALSEYTF